MRIQHFDQQIDNSVSSKNILISTNVTIQQEMPDLHLWVICVILLIGSGSATDIPYVFDEKSPSLAGHTSEQLERMSSSSADLLGVQPISVLSDNEVIEISETGKGGDGRGPVTKTRWTIDEIKNVFDTSAP
jgi:hypothetical protein